MADATTKSAQAPSNFEVHLHTDDTVVVMCTQRGARFHIWADEALIPSGPYVYKNAPLELKPGDAGYFRTRRLLSHVGEGKFVFNAMMAEAPALLSGARQRYAEAQAAEAVARQQRIAEANVRNAAHVLLAALIEMLEAWDEQFGEGACDCQPEPQNAGHVCQCCKARAAIAMAGGAS